MKYILFFIQTGIIIILTIVITGSIFVFLKTGSLPFSKQKGTAPYEATYQDKTNASDTENDIGEERIIRIVLNRIPGAFREDIIRLDLEYEDGYIIYKGNLQAKKTSYYFEIDGTDGTILCWEVRK